MNNNLKEILDNLSDYKEIFRLHGIYKCYYDDKYEGTGYTESLTLPIVLIQSLNEPKKFILYIEYEFDPEKRYTNNGPRNTILQSQSQILLDEIDHEMYESLVDDILSYDLIYKGVVIFRHKGIQLIYHAFRNRPNFEDKFPIDELKDPTKQLFNIGRRREPTNQGINIGGGK